MFGPASHISILALLILVLIELPIRGRLPSVGHVPVRSWENSGD